MQDWAEGIWLSISWTQLFGLAILSALVLSLAGHLLPLARTVRGVVEIKAAPAHLFPLMADAQNQLSWRRELAAVTELADGGWSETYASGEVIRFRTIESRPYRHLSLRFFSDRGFQGHWRAELIPLANGLTRLELEEEIKILHPWKRLVSHVLFDHKARLEQYLADLSAAAKAKRWQ